MVEHLCKGLTVTVLRPQPIDDPDDPRLEAYRDIRERDLVGRGGRFIAEGELVVRMLAASRHHQLESLLLLESRAGRLGDLVAELAPATPVFVAPRTVLDQITGFPVHRGVLAVGRRGAEVDHGALLAMLPRESIVLALVGIANHDNVGALFRNAAAFGVGAVLLDASCCDPLYRKAIRVSVGHVLHVPFSRGGSAEGLADVLEQLGFGVVGLSSGAATPIERHAWAPRTALVVGAEGPGLPPALLRRVKPVAIPMEAGVDSLNVATAAGIALHAARLALSRAAA